MPSVVTSSSLIGLLVCLPVSAAAALASRAANKQKFEAMLAACTLPPAAIEVIDEPKMRTLFRGVAAAAEEPEVRTAFSIVYEDLGPVRVAGDLIFKQLKKIAYDAGNKVAGLEALETADADAIAAARSLFDAIDEDASGGLTRDELLASPVLLGMLRPRDDAAAVSGHEDEAAVVDAFLSSADTDGDGEISFVEFALASAARSGTGLRLADEAINTALGEMLMMREGGAAGAAGNDGAASQRKKPKVDRSAKHGERFDEMLATCLEWEALYLCREVPNDAPDEELDGCATPEAATEAAAAAADEGNRLQQVLLGTFAGGRVPAVADALRVCYAEYSALRFGGDLIFKILKRVVAATLKP